MFLLACHFPYVIFTSFFFLLDLARHLRDNDEAVESKILFCSWRVAKCALIYHRKLYCFLFSQWQVKIVAFDSFDGEETDREKVWKVFWDLFMITLLFFEIHILMGMTVQLMRLEGGMNSFIDPFTRKPLVPAVGLPYSLKRIWETIRRKENLNLSNVKVRLRKALCRCYFCLWRCDYIWGINSKLL